MLRYYFFFSNSRTSWISRLFKRGFQHVELLGETSGGLVFHVNPRWGCVDYSISGEFPLADCVARLREHTLHCVLYRCPAPDPKTRIKRGVPITCASYLAYTIGLPFSGMTPHQLYKKLKRKGAMSL